MEPTAATAFAAAMIPAIIALPANAGLSAPPKLAVGDAIGGSAVVLAAPASGTGTVLIEASTDPSFVKVDFSGSVVVTDPLVPGKAQLTGLAGGERYYVRATVDGAVRTATLVSGASAFAAPSAISGVRFGVTGDWRGDVGIYNAILNADERGLDFFVKLGDTIYADVASPAVPVPQCQTIEEFRAKHVENYAPAHGIDPWGDLAASTATFSMIDDHEVTNDFDGGAFDPATGWFNQGSLYVNGLQAFVEHNAIAPTAWPAVGDPRVDGRPMLYRSFKWGKDASVFMVDARSFRDASLPPVSNPFDPAEVTAFITAAFNPSRTMLGYPQLAKLLGDLAAAQAAGVTWKFVMTSMPMQNFGPLAGEDRWEGYAAERAYLLGQILQLGIRNVVFVTADFHGTIVNDVTAPNPLNPSQQLFTGMFEIITGSVAYSAPAGPTFAQLGLSTGVIDAQQYAYYQSLPGFAQDLFVQGLLDGVVAQYGYSPTGIDDPSIADSFVAGGPVAAHHYGWTEFEVDAASKALTVTTWGVDWYTPAEAAADPQAIIARPITVRQRFTVTPQAAPCPGDLNGDRSVDGVDLAMLLGAWGPGVGSPADLNGDGSVNGADVGLLFAAWGSCPG
jgi:3-phytase/alkaline phosphatase D